jgi:hypothetical protein
VIQALKSGPRTTREVGHATGLQNAYPALRQLYGRGVVSRLALPGSYTVLWWLA